MKHTSSSATQQGFVSIVVCLIIMIILSLVTIGFAQIMSKEQTQALDRQLSSQAFYAAESGVNDARVDMNSFTTTCSPVVAYDAAQTVKSTCVFVNKQPKTVQEDNVGIPPKVFPIHTVNAAGTPTVPATLTIRWKKSSSTAGWTDFNSLAPNRFPAQGGAWGVNTGVGKVYLVPFKNGDTRDAIISKTGFMLLNPVALGASPNVPLASIQGQNSGKIINGSCVVATSECTAIIDTGFPASPAPAPYDELYMVISALYSPSNFTIEGADSAGSSLLFSDVQAVVDSTGRTTDVLRRIQVRVPLINSYSFAGSALTTFGSGPTNGLCKLWTGIPDPTLVNSANACP